MRKKQQVRQYGVVFELELFMVDRHWLGDLARATLLALPLAMLAWPAAATISNSGNNHGVQVASARATPASGRMSVLG